MEWKDGLASEIMRVYVKDETNTYRWVVFDGPVDAIWIENMNTVLDDNMMLCLSNGERIKLKPDMRMLFEVQDLAVASPATVSRCGMVWVPDDTIGWETFIKTFLENTLDKKLFNEELMEFTVNEFLSQCVRCVSWMKKNGKEPIESGEMGQIQNTGNLFHSLTNPEIGFSVEDIPIDTMKQNIQKLMIFAMAWGFGGGM